MKKEKIGTWMAVAGLLLVLAGIIIPFFAGVYTLTYKIIFSAGALLALIGRLMSQYKGDNLRLRRIYRLEIWSAVFFCVAAFLLFYPSSPLQWSFRDSLAFTLAGGAVQAYVSIMAPIIAKKK